MTSTLQAPPAPAKAARANPAIGMWVVLVGQLMLVLDATIVNVALPHIATDLRFGSASLSWVLNAYSLAFGGLLLLGGRLGDVLGRRRVFMTGLSLFTLASFAGGLAHAPWELVTSRALQGVGAALAAPSVLALITTNAPNEAARNRALAAFAVISSGGAALGLMLGGTLTDLVSWRWTMFVNVPIGLAVLALAPGLVNETARRHGRFDFVGAASATGAAVSIVWTVINAPEYGWASARTIGGFVLGGALLVLLAAHRTPAPAPAVAPGAAAQPQADRGPHLDGGPVRRHARDLLPHRSVAGPPVRLQPHPVGCRLPAGTARCLHHVAPDAPSGSADRTGPADRRRHCERLRVDGPTGQRGQHHRLPHRCAPVVAVVGPGCGHQLHADHGAGPRGRRAGTHRSGLWSPADDAAARRSRGARRGGLGLRRTQGSRLRRRAAVRVRRRDRTGRARLHQRGDVASPAGLARWPPPDAAAAHRTDLARRRRT